MGSLRQRVVVAPACLAVLMAGAVPVPATSPAVVNAVVWPSATCPALAGTVALQDDLAQSMDGALTGCLRVPVVPPGTYYVTLQDVLSRPVLKKPFPSVPSSTGVASVQGPHVVLSVLPSAASPGQTVKVEGTVAAPVALRPEYANFCWDGCMNGLVYDGVQLSWSSPTAFSAQLVLPAAPWAETGGNGVTHFTSPLPGRYGLAVECLQMAKGCSLGAPEGQTTLRLESAARYTCGSVPGCGRLSASPGAKAPGSVVEFSGYAPLENVIGSRYPFAFELTASTHKPAGTGALVIGDEMTVGPATVRVSSAVIFRDLGRYRPVSRVVAGDVPVSANPLSQSYVGWCAEGHIEVHGPAGGYQVPITGAARWLASTRSYSGQPAQRCDSLLMGPTPGSLFASFLVQPANQEPVFADVAMFTTDQGRTWRPVPVPDGTKATDFGGFRYLKDGIEALFSAPPAQTKRTKLPLVEETADAGQHWQEARFACPGTGPCVTFGAHVVGNCAQGLDSQYVIASQDHGVHWETTSLMGPFGPAAMETCSTATLVALSDRTTLLVTSNSVLPSTSPFDVLVMSDYGRAWGVVALPALPEVAIPRGANVPPGPGDLVVLGNGALLAVDQQPWYLLAPGSGAWCSVTAAPGTATGTFTVPDSFAVVGDQLWWLVQAVSGAHITAHRLNVSALECGRGG